MAEENNQTKPSGFTPPPLLSSLSKPAKLSAAPTSGGAPPPSVSGSALPIPSARPKSVKRQSKSNIVDAPPEPVIKKQSIMVQKSEANLLAAKLSPHTEEVSPRIKIGTAALSQLSHGNILYIFLI